MTITDDEVRAIDEAARVLRRVARALDCYDISVDVRGDGRVEIRAGFACERGDLLKGGAHPSPGEALRRLVGR